ncbi:MAG: sugar ABC transporter permease [Spirochaetales bacterium]|nr:sugar ABC transporter permease [Spirochaetales bacterium]
MKKISRLHNDFNVALLFILPSFLGFTIFILIPIVNSFIISFTNYSGSFQNIHFTGFKNYILVISDPKFWQSMWVTLFFVFVAVTMQLVTGFIFACILNKDIRGRVAFRSILFLPVVLSSVAVCLSFLLIFHPSKGPVNSFLKSIGLSPVPWLADKSTALLTILIVFTWQFFGYYMVIFLSGLQTINPILYEAADIDGASEINKLFHITLPGLSPVIFFSFIIAIINAFKAFDHIFIMTGGQYGGGPAGSTRVLAFDIYQNGFIFWQIGYGAAESVILFLIIFLITIVQYRMQQKWVSYHVV